VAEEAARHAMTKMTTAEEAVAAAEAAVDVLQEKMTMKDADGLAILKAIPKRQ